MWVCRGLGLSGFGSVNVCGSKAETNAGLQPGIAARGAAFTIEVASLEQCRWALHDGGVPHRLDGEQLIVPASHGCGMAVHFRQKQGGQ